MTSTLPTHPVLRHPLTGVPLRAIGFTRRGTPIWPVMGGSQPTGDPASPPADPAPAPGTPPAPAPPQGTPPTPTPSQVFPPQPATPASPPAPPATGNGEHGFPENTPLAQMTDAQQAAYWRYHSRKHEARANATSDYEQVKQQLADLQAAGMTEQQKAVAEAEARGRQAALAEAGGALVEQFMRAALVGRKTDDEITALIGPLDRKYFLSGDGLSVDTGKVTAWAASVAPAAPTQPAVPAPQPTPTPPAAPSTPAVGQPATGTPAQPLDMGQGTRTTPKPSGLAAGAALARERFGLNKPAH